MKSKVYFTKEITKENLVKLYKTLGKELPGKVAVKVHSGEDGNQNFLRPEFMEDIIKSFFRNNIFFVFNNIFCI